MKVGNIDIKKAYFGTKELTSKNAFIGVVPIIEEENMSKIILRFNGNAKTWYLEDNMNMHGDYYQLGNEEPVPFTYRPTFADYYIYFSSSQIANKNLNIYTNPTELYSYKGIKRKYKGLISVDLSNAKGPMYWYFWNNNTYSDLQTIKFPKTFTKVLVDFGGSFNNITIPAENNIIINSGCIYNNTMRNVVFENKPYYMRFWGGNITSANVQKFINNFSALNINLARGILGVTSTGYNNMTTSQIQALAAMNIDVRVSSSSNQFYDVNWDF